MKNENQEPELILVFKTNLKHRKDVGKITSLLNMEQEIINWNVDLSDVDNVLRIESIQIAPQKIIQIISSAGYNCEELQD